MNRVISALICVLFLLLILPINAKADTGPKSSVRVQFDNMGEQLCYGTLLSKDPRTGPYSVWDGDEENINTGGYDIEIWRAFTEYEDAEGYYFLQPAIWCVSTTGRIAWTYYPPSSFKILLYYPELDKFVVSGVYERYAFDTYYTVSMSGIDICSQDCEINAYRSYDYTAEILSLIARIAITLGIEILVALIFGFRERKQLIFLAAVNAVTQIILNLLLNIINYNSGWLASFICYFLLEHLVLLIEAIAYSVFMNKLTDKPRRIWIYIVYALVANALSLLSGVFIAVLLPGIF